MFPTFSRRLLALLSLIAIYYGFRFVAQAGQGMMVVQNDGYTVTGGFMIGAGFFVIGYLVADGKKFNKKK